MLACVLVTVTSALNADEMPTAKLSEMATRQMASDPQSALELFGHVLERTPDDVVTLYKASSVRLSLGQYSKAKDGFAKVLLLKPDQEQARLQLAKLHAKLAEYPEAKKHIKLYLKNSGRDAEEAKQLKDQLEQAEKLDRTKCDALQTLVQLSPYSADLRLRRVACSLRPPEPDYPSALADIGRAASLDPSLSFDWFVKAGLIAAFFIDEHVPPTEYQAFLKRCLAADPDNKKCARTLRELKKFKKAIDKLANWRDAARWNEVVVAIRGSSTTDDGLVESAERIIKTADAELDPARSPVTTMLLSTLCKAYVHLGNTRKASEPCRLALARNPDDAWALVSKATDAERDEEWDVAVSALTKAFEATGRTDRDILARLQKAQRLLKQSKTKDYYKVLGVARDADDKTIKRAYRKGTLKSHPDKEGGSQERMAALNEAYGVLSDPGQSLSLSL